MSNLSEEQLHDARLAEYKEVAQNFRTLTEIRFKLLGLTSYRYRACCSFHGVE